MAKEDNKIFIVGINHKTAPFEIREKFQLGRKDILAGLRMMKEYPGIAEMMLVTTCNRIGFYMVLEPGADAFELVDKFYTDYRGISPQTHKENFFIESSPNVTRHLFRVISGLESMVVGEYQIQGQVKEAYSLACQEKTVDTVLHKLLHAAFRVGKKVRNNTTLGEGKQSVSGVASQIMLDNLSPRDTVLVIGVNENSKIMTQALRSAGFDNFIFANRTKYKADMMAEKYGGKARDLSAIEKSLFDADAVFTSTSAPGFIVTTEKLNHLIVQERCPKLIVDMAIPRDIDTKEIPDEIKVYDIGALQDYLDKQIKKQLIDLPKAEKIIENEVQIFQAWSDTPSSNVLKPYAENFEMARQQVLEESKDQFSEQALERVDKLSRSLMHRLKSTFIRVLIKEQQKFKK